MNQESDNSDNKGIKYAAVAIGLVNKPKVPVHKDFRCAIILEKDDDLFGKYEKKFYEDSKVLDNPGKETAPVVLSSFRLNNRYGSITIKELHGWPNTSLKVTYRK